MNIDEKRSPALGGLEFDEILLSDWRNGIDRCALAQQANFKAGGLIQVLADIAAKAFRCEVIKPHYLAHIRSQTIRNNRNLMSLLCVIERNGFRSHQQV